MLLQLMFPTLCGAGRMKSANGFGFRFREVRDSLHEPRKRRRRKDDSNIRRGNSKRGNGKTVEQFDFVTGEIIAVMIITLLLIYILCLT